MTLLKRGTVSWIFSEECSNSFAGQPFHKTGLRERWERVFICLVSQIIIILVELRKGSSQYIIGQILLLFWEQWKNLRKTWKTEAFEQNYFRKKLLQCISQNSMKRTSDEVLTYLCHSLGLTSVFIKLL